MGAELSGGMITYMSPAARAPLLASVIHVTLSCNLRFNVQCGNRSAGAAARVGPVVGLPRPCLRVGFCFARECHARSAATVQLPLPQRP